MRVGREDRELPVRDVPTIHVRRRGGDGDIGLGGVAVLSGGERTNLKSRLYRGSITIPMHPKLLAELRTLEFRGTASGHMTIHHPGGGSDDYADALMLACWPFRLREEDSRIRVIPRAGPPWG